MVLRIKIEKADKKLNTGGMGKMSELKEEHFEVIDSNKAKVYQDQKAMREDSLQFVGSCSIFDLQEVYKLIKRLKERK
tara:strand:- start:3210 stop:3443 length:234 start_codon:yes stop_codon:yes gene_type:complete